MRNRKDQEVEKQLRKDYNELLNAYNNLEPKKVQEVQVIEKIKEVIVKQEDP